MCYSVQALLETQLKRAVKSQNIDAIIELREKLAVFGVENYFHTNGFQHKPMLLEYANRFEIASWGLIPNWINDERAANEIRTKTINARKETLMSKPSFKKAYDSGRSVLVVDGFFDFQKNKSKNIPHFLHLENNQPLALACISDSWVNEKSGELINSFSIVTEKGKGVIEKIHLDKEPRLPVILAEKAIENWLETGELIDSEIGESLISHKVGPLSGKHYKGNVPEVTDEAAPIDGDQFSLF